MISLLIKSIILSSLFYSFAFAYTAVTSVKYEGGISIFGKVAQADIVLEEDFDNNRYKMSVRANSIGIVKALTSNREDGFISEGMIKDGVYIPDKFTRSIYKNGYKEEIVYTFDYSKNEVLKKTFKTEDVEECSYDIIKMERVVDIKTVHSTSEEVIDLKYNDYISLFLNLNANNIKVGSVDYIDQKESDDVMLISKTMFEVSKDDGDEIYRINFSRGNSMFFDKAVALDIALYGDAYLEKVSEEKMIK